MAFKPSIQSQTCIENVHRVIKFSQKPWLKQFNDMNTEKREIAKTDFENHFLKAMNNAVFGKKLWKR